VGGEKAFHDITDLENEDFIFVYWWIVLMAKFRFEMCLFGGCINHSTFSSLPLHMSESAVDPGDTAGAGRLSWNTKLSRVPPPSGSRPLNIAHSSPRFPACARKSPSLFSVAEKSNILPV
jgi:hypothetical protein